MAEGKKKDISVLIATKDGKKLTDNYLLLLIQYMNQQNYIDSYEIVVSDEGAEDYSTYYANNGYQNTRYVKSDTGRGKAKTLNTGIYNCTKHYVLILDENMMPANNYFEKTLPLFGEVNNVFGISCLTYDADGKASGCAFTPRLSKIGIINCNELHTTAAPIYTFKLSISNMLVDKQKIGIMLGFVTLFDLDCEDDIDCSLRAWRYSWKCIYTPMTSCRQLEKSEQSPIYRSVKKESNKILLNYLHTTGWSHKKIMMKWLGKFLISGFYPSVTWKAYRKASVGFIKIYLESRELRNWYYKNIHSDVPNVIETFFKGDLSILSNKEK